MAGLGFEFMILVTGANGYVGVHLIEMLCGEGMVLRALVRRGCSADERNFLAALGAEVCEADIQETDRLMRALEGVETVVHLVGSIERPAEGYRCMHTRRTKLLLDAFRGAMPASRNTRPGSRLASGGRVVYLSAVGASAGAGNLYARTKWEAEEEIRHSEFDHVIVRSSLIFGRETGRRDSKLIRKIEGLAAGGKILPLIAAGRNRLQPIYIGNLVRCLREAVVTTGSPRETWDVGGPEVLTLREIAAAIMDAHGFQRRIVGIPYPIAYLLGWCARLARREGKLNLEQIRMSRCDTICACSRAPSLCGRRLVTFTEGMKRSAARDGSGPRSRGAHR
jgi:NADH dehydrogenase